MGLTTMADSDDWEHESSDDEDVGIRQNMKNLLQKYNNQVKLHVHFTRSLHSKPLTGFDVNLMLILLELMCNQDDIASMTSDCAHKHCFACKELIHGALVRVGTRVRQ